jgi:hypothetical protein
MSKLSKTLFGALLAVPLLTVLGSSNALADPYRHGHWGGDIHHFHDRDFGRWRAGHWYHGWNGGRYTWWWIAGGTWYPYPAPVRPYPDPYQPPVVVVQQPQQQPPQYVQQSDPDANVTSTAPLPSAPAPSSATQYWYYCASPSGYYPYIAQCQGGWQKVPASPPQ